MEQTIDYLFVYGTLLDDSNEFAAYLSNNCSFYSQGKFKGMLYDIGEYPGAIADEGYPGYVYGHVFVIADVEETLKYLDDYEGYGDEQQQPNLFVREMVRVDTDSGIVNCEVYLYNLSVDGLRWIESGDYLAYNRY